MTLRAGDKLIAEGIEVILFRTVGDRPPLWESLLPAEVLRLPAELARVDALLDDPVFFAPFAPYFHPVLGRPSTPAECCLRLMFLEFRYRLSYESLCAQVTDNDDGIVLDYSVEYGAAPDTDAQVLGWAHGGRRHRARVAISYHRANRTVPGRSPQDPGGFEGGGDITAASPGVLGVIVSGQRGSQRHGVYGSCAEHMTVMGPAS